MSKTIYLKDVSLLNKFLGIIEEYVQGTIEMIEKRTYPSYSTIFPDVTKYEISDFPEEFLDNPPF